MSTSEVFRVLKPFHWFDHMIASNHRTSHSIMTSTFSMWHWVWAVSTWLQSQSHSHSIVNHTHLLDRRATLSLPLDTEERKSWMKQIIKLTLPRVFFHGSFSCGEESFGGYVEDLNFSRKKKFDWKVSKTKLNWITLHDDLPWVLSIF